MLQVLGQLLIIIIAIGGLLLLIKALPLDETAKTVGTILVWVVGGIWAVTWLLNHIPRSLGG